MIDFLSFFFCGGGREDEVKQVVRFKFMGVRC